jgi:hypothetical protein
MQSVSLIKKIACSDPLYALGLGAMAFIKGNTSKSSKFYNTILKISE